MDTFKETVLQFAEETSEEEAATHFNMDSERIRSWRNQRAELLSAADVRKVIVGEEEQQEWSSSLDQEDPEPPHIKEEQEELWSSQEGEQLQGLEEADITKFTFTSVPVKSEDDEEKPQSSQMETEADGEDCGGPEPDRNSHPDTHLTPETEDKTGDSSEIEVSFDDWEETREPQSGLNSYKDDEVPVSESRCSAAEKPFRCSECGKSFATKAHLKRHMITHTGEKPFSCSVCKKYFTQSANLKRHMSVHSGEKPFSCSVCDKIFLFKGNLKTHMRTHTGEKPFSCSVCKKSFSENGTLKIHTRSHTGEKPYSCSVCNERFVWRYQVKKHKCVGHQSSQLHQTQTEQMETEADGENCGGPEPDRNSHPDTHVTPETEDKTGDSSETETDDSDDWKKTREPQSGSDSLKDDEVPDSVERCREKLFLCSVCGKRFGIKSNLKTHMRTHTGEKPFNCSVCKKYFTQSGTLKKHMSVHSGEKPFSCSVCRKSFTQNANLKRHISVHSGEKPFCCSVCGKRFPGKRNLVQHMKFHTGEKPFSCSVCKKSFTRNGHLQKHMITHSREKPFSCGVCDQRFVRHNHLKKHKCVGRQSSQLHRGQTEQMETEADGEDCGGPEPVRNSDQQ